MSSALVTTFSVLLVLFFRLAPVASSSAAASFSATALADLNFANSSSKDIASCDRLMSVDVDDIPPAFSISSDRERGEEDATMVLFL